MPPVRHRLVDEGVDHGTVSRRSVVRSSKCSIISALLITGRRWRSRARMLRRRRRVGRVGAWNGERSYGGFRSSRRTAVSDGRRLGRSTIRVARMPRRPSRKAAGRCANGRLTRRFRHGIYSTVRSMLIDVDRCSAAAAARSLCSTARATMPSRYVLRRTHVEFGIGEELSSESVPTARKVTASVRGGGWVFPASFEDAAEYLDTTGDGDLVISVYERACWVCARRARNSSQHGLPGDSFARRRSRSAPTSTNPSGPATVSANRALLRRRSVRCASRESEEEVVLAGRTGSTRPLSRSRRRARSRRARRRGSPCRGTYAERRRAPRGGSGH